MDTLLQTIDARGVATLTLNRPERHNAFDDVLIAEMTAALRALEAESRVRVAVLASTGRSFCAGADLGWMRRMAAYGDAENLDDARALAGMLHALDRLRVPTIARVQGQAFGGGVGLICCCDVAVSVAGARFGLTEVRLGLIPATISPYVAAAIGARWSRRLFATGEAVDAARAAAIGLVHEVVADEAALDAAVTTCVEAVLRGGPQAVAEAKSLVFLREGRASDAALREETSGRIAARRATAEAREGLGAFLARRDPPWVAGG